MNAQVMTKAQANLDLALWNAEAESIDSSDLYIWLRESGLAPEIAIRLKDLIDVAKNVAGQIINVGKIVLIKIIEFIKSHPNLSVGIALGGAVGLLVNTIPFLGPLLMPIVTLLGISLGAIAGHQLDKKEKGHSFNNGINPIVITQDIIEIAREFFKLFIDVFNLIFDKDQYGAA